jgi:hypothetical protein
MGRIKDEYGISTTLLRAQIEERIPAAFSTYKRPEHGSIPTGIASIDVLVQGVPLHALTEICGAGKTSVLVSLLARASQEHHCALVDASDAFDPVGAEAAGTDLSRLLWVRCGKTKQKLRPLEQAFNVTDMLLQSSGGFGLIVVDLSDIAEKAGIRTQCAHSWPIDGENPLEETGQISAKRRNRDWPVACDECH